MVWGAIAAAGVSALGSFIGGERANAANSARAREAMEFEAGQAQINREFQERMSNTAHQREVADLRAAGLNPILSAGGPGASSPSGSMADGKMIPAVDTLSPAISSGMQARRLAEELKLMKAETANKKADTSLKEQQEVATKVQQQKTATETFNLFKQGYILDEQVGTAKATKELTELQSKRSQDWGESTLGNQAATIERAIRRLLKLAD